MSQGFKVSHLLNFINEDVERCMSHGLDSKLICAQAQAIEIPIIQRKVTWNTYEREFKKAIRELKQVSVKGAVFGDVDLQEHKDWVDRVCEELDIESIEPLWNANPEQILTDFINEGFDATVVRAKANLLGEEWLGRKIDGNFVRELHKLKNKSNFHILGEDGEYHTFVTSGPLFKQRIRILESDKVLKNGYWSLNISKWKID
jgi:uncharacterized protein (TIGR00290 family)